MFHTRVRSDAVGRRLDAGFYNPQYVSAQNALARFPLRTMESLRADGAPIGYGVVKPRFQESSVRMVRIQDFSDPFVDLESSASIDPEQMTDFKRSACLPGDLLVAIGGYPGRLGLLPPLPDGVSAVNINQHIVRVRFAAAVERYFVAAFLMSSTGERVLARQVSGSVQAGVNVEDFRLITVPFVAADAQRYIGDKVRQAERLRERARDIAGALSRLETNIPVPLPEVNAAARRNWEAARGLFDPIRLDPKYYAPEFLHVARATAGSREFLRVGDVVDNIRYGASVEADYVAAGKGLPFIRGTDLGANRIRLSEVVDLHPRLRAAVGGNLLRKNQILITRSGTVGIAAVVTEAAEGAAYGSFMMSMSLKAGQNPYFVAWYINSWVGQNQIRRRENGAIQQNINIEELSSVSLWQAPESFQAQIERQVIRWLCTLVFAERLTQIARLLVERLIEGRLIETDLVAAQKALEVGDRSADREILKALRQSDAPDAKPLIADVDALYALLDESEDAR